MSPPITAFDVPRMWKFDETRCNLCNVVMTKPCWARTKDHMSVRMTNDTKNDSSTSKMSGLFQRTLTRKAMKYAIG